MKPTNENRKRADELLRATGRYEAAEPIQNPTREFCKSQVGRLLGKPYAPTVPEAIGELVDTLVTHAENPDHAKRIVEHFVGTSGPCPQPAELMGRALETRGLAVQFDPQCPRGCSGGWLIEGDSERRAERCTCWAERPIIDEPWQVGRRKEEAGDWPWITPEEWANFLSTHRLGPLAKEQKP